MEKRNVSIQDIIYTAGLFDGEGWVGMQGGTNVGVRIVNTNYDVIQWLHSKWGGGIYKRQNRSRFIQKQVYDWWLIDQKDVENFVGEIYPYLIIKRVQVDRALDIKKSLLETRSRRGKINSENIQQYWNKKKNRSVS